MTELPYRAGSSFWQHLRRRKVVEWGLAYAAGAWALLQAVGFFADAFHWPEPVKQIAAISLLAGFPVVVTLAWYHGDRGEQRVSRTEFAVLAVLLLLGGGALWRFAQREVPATVAATATADGPPVTAPGARVSAADPAGPSIAVLPFENRSRLEDDAFFVDGIHDDILTQLSKLSALKVISRTSVEKFRDTELSTREIAGQLGATSLLEGGVQRAGGRVRINVQLIDAASDAHLWAENYDRELTTANIFAIQSEVAAAIAGALKTTLTPDEKARVVSVPTQSVEAWETYQLGRQQLARRTSESLDRAEAMFRKAIRADGDFALAYVGLSDALRLSTLYSGRSKDEARTASMQAARQALQLDPMLGEAWTAYAASLDEREVAPDQIEEAWRRAVELNPNYPVARQWYGEFLYLNARPLEAIEQIRLAVELDPLEPVLHAELGNAQSLAGRLSDAEASYRKAIALSPAFALAHVNLGWLIRFGYGRPADAIAHFEEAGRLDPGSPIPAVAIAFAAIDVGDLATAERLATELPRRFPYDGTANAVPCFLKMLEGERDPAIRCLRPAVAQDPLGWATTYLGNLYLGQGDTEAAVELARRVRPGFFVDEPRLNLLNRWDAVILAAALIQMGNTVRANQLLDAVTATTQRITSPSSRAICEVQVLALRGEKSQALAALRVLQRDGWRGPLWRFHRDIDATLESIRNDPEFEAVFADIERDMARQRTELARRPKDAPLDVGDTRP